MVPKQFFVAAQVIHHVQLYEQFKVTNVAADMRFIIKTSPQIVKIFIKSNPVENDLHVGKKV